MSASSPLAEAAERMVRRAGDLGRRHGRAAVYWQIGDSGAPAAREFYRELLAGIACGDPAITGLFDLPDLTGRHDYQSGDLAADLELADGDPALPRAAEAYLAGAREEFWLEAARLAFRRLTAEAADGTEVEGEDGTEQELIMGGEPAPDWRQDITDSATGLSRLLSERCATCIMSAGDPMHLGPERTAAFIRHALEADSYVVCHDTLSDGDFPDYGPAICRGFFDAFGDRTRDLLLLRAARRLTEVPPPGVAIAGELGRAAGQAAAGRAPGGSAAPPAFGPAAGYAEDDLARDLGLDSRDRGLPQAAAAYAGAFAAAFLQETERAAREHAG